MPSRVKNLLLGDPLHNEAAQHQRLSNPIALAVFSSDAISSTAYATGEIILILSLAGTAVLSLTWPIALAIGVLLMIVIFSYRQTIKAYPHGGGSYIVARENLGTMPGLIAGASLLVDYILTVSVSVSAGTAAITSAFPGIRPYTVEIALVFVAILMVGNLRGVRESGLLFSGPTFAFIGLLSFTVLWGIFKYFTVGVEAIQVPPPPEPIEAMQGLTLFLILKAFASGCAALTGVEAIANGVMAFREPTWKNARKTLLAMGGILMFLFLGLSWLAVQAGVQNPEHETVISQLSRQLFGTGVMYYLISFATMAVLVIAANTAYADFPRLASFMAEDDFLPHQLRDRGYRLVHSNGVILLTIAASVLIVVFGGATSALIPLYAIGVFTAFTLSQFGMVVHWWKLREPQWQWSIVVNAVGGVTTMIVLGVIAATKFSTGAWIVLIIIPILVAYFLWVARSYSRVRQELKLPEEELVDLNWQAYNRMHNHVVVLVKSIDRRLVKALQYAKTLRADKVEALYVDPTSESADKMRRDWEEAGFGIKLRVVESHYREVIAPILDYIRAIPRPTPDHVVTVVLPEYAPENWADSMLHDQTSFWIKQQLFQEPRVILTDVPYHLGDDEDVPICSERLAEVRTDAVCQLPPEPPKATPGGTHA
ncbi:MAG: APC family permease [Coriobacteriales bacterium]|nr:APC family permease [Coriobacteriales bacterium]